MSNQSVTYLVAAVCGVFSLAVFAALILVPAWSAYTRVWERLAATLLSFYVLLALVSGGVGAGLVLVYFWDRL